MSLDQVVSVRVLGGVPRALFEELGFIALVLVIQDGVRTLVMAPRP